MTLLAAYLFSESNHMNFRTHLSALDLFNSSQAVGGVPADFPCERDLIQRLSTLNHPKPTVLQANSIIVASIGQELWLGPFHISRLIKQDALGISAHPGLVYLVRSCGSCGTYRTWWPSTN